MGGPRPGGRSPGGNRVRVRALARTAPAGSDRHRKGIRGHDRGGGRRRKRVRCRSGNRARHRHRLRRGLFGAGPGARRARRGLRLLEALSRREDGAGVTELALACGVPKASVHRLLDQS
ncbi:helix-turn-helix domain-containing protein [Streptomyces cirratus]